MLLSVFAVLMHHDDCAPFALNSQMAHHQSALLPMKVASTVQAAPFRSQKACVYSRDYITTPEACLTDTLQRHPR